MTLAWIPDSVKQQILDGVVDFLAKQGEKYLDQAISDKIRSLSSHGAMQRGLDQALQRAVVCFEREYVEIDEDLVGDMLAAPDFWQSREVRKAILALITRPGLESPERREQIVGHFESVLPQRRNRDRVDRAVTFLLRCVAEEVWNLPAASQIREMYALQMQRTSADAMQRQVALVEEQIRATQQLGADMRQALLQLVDAQKQSLLAAPATVAALPRPRPYHNLPQPDYTRFVGREQELAWLRQRLAPGDRVWQALIVGIGGVGKSALAQAIAHEYRERYHDLPAEERFEAIVWVSAKEEVLTFEGQEPAALEALIFRTLDDIYTAIAQTLEREDITRALPEDQDRLVRKALGEQRALLIVDNLESVADKRVKTFLRQLPPPTKVILTSREWISTADVLPLTGLPEQEALALIAAEREARHVNLDRSQQQRLFERTAGLPLPMKLSLARLASGETSEAVFRWLGNAEGDLPECCVKGQADLIHSRAPHAWRLLLACSLFDRDAGASRDALGYVADLAIADRDKGFMRLLRLSLINRTDADRFWLLPIVQAYTSSQLAKTEFASDLIERWLAWLLNFVQLYGTKLERYIERTSAVSLEYPNLRNAIRWCRERRRWQDVLKLAEGAEFYADIVGRLGELREILDAVLEAAHNLGDQRREGWAESHLGMLARVQGQYDRALTQHLGRAEEIARHQNDLALLGDVWYIRSDI